MIDDDVEVLARAHGLFPDAHQRVMPISNDAVPSQPMGAGDAHESYRGRLSRDRAALTSATQTDAEIARIVAAAYRDQATARETTGHVVAEARADPANPADSSLAQREQARRRAARLRAQHAHVQAAYRRARRHRRALRQLGYPAAHRRRAPTNRAARAVRAALSRLGRPYLWGASGPNRFDCSGLIQWSYAQAGVHLDRTTYQQIHQGIAVPRGYVRPGDLVFPHPGHVQMAIGNNLVVESPHPGATVRISPLGTQVQIRRPV